MIPWLHSLICRIEHSSTVPWGYTIEHRSIGPCSIEHRSWSIGQRPTVLFTTVHRITVDYVSGVSGQNPTGQKPIGQYPSGQNPRRTKTQGDKIPWGQTPRGTISKWDKSPGGQKPRGTKTHRDKNPWRTISKRTISQGDKFPRFVYLY